MGRRQGTRHRPPRKRHFGRDLDVTVSPTTYRNAKALLVTHGILETNDGPTTSRYPTHPRDPRGQAIQHGRSAVSTSPQQAGTAEQFTVEVRDSRGIPRVQPG
jgi:hypothetical protein